MGACSIICLSLGLKKMPAYGLQVRHFAVQQGDAALVEYQGQTLLIDSGPHPSKVLHAIRRRGLRRLDAILISHAHSDHIRGTKALIEELQVGCIELPEHPEKSLYLLELEQIAQQNRVPKCNGKMPWETVRIFQNKEAVTKKTNNESMLVEIEAEGWRLLFTGDIEEESENALVPQLQSSDWLKVAHHGSRSSSSRRFLETVRPTHCVISSGIHNPFGHPHKRTLARLAGCSLHRTDGGQDVVLRVRGPQSWVD